MRNVSTELSQLKDNHLYRTLSHRNVPSASSNLEHCTQKKQLCFSSNDYLGLAKNPILTEALAAGCYQYGNGATASRLVCGNFSVHTQAEQALASLKQTDSALLFSSGYAAAIGTVSSLAQKGDFIFLDRLIHASLLDGAKLSGASYRPFRHNDLTHLEQQLQKAHQKSTAQTRILILAESVYSMDGDCAPVAKLHQLAEQYDALLLLDEAHALGVLGPQGRGLAAQANISHSTRLIQLGTLSKAAGLQGGFVAAQEDWIKLIVNRARSFIYTTGVLPALAAAIPTAIKLITSKWGEDQRAILQKHICQFQLETQETKQIQITLNENLNQRSAILPLVLGAEEKAIAVANQLQEQGFFVPAIRYPTVAKGKAKLRITLSSTHKEAEISALCSCLAQEFAQIKQAN